MHFPFGPHWNPQQQGASKRVNWLNRHGTPLSMFPEVWQFPPTGSQFSDPSSCTLPKRKKTLSRKNWTQITTLTFHYYILKLCQKLTPFFGLIKIDEQILSHDIFNDHWAQGYDQNYGNGFHHYKTVWIVEMTNNNCMMVMISVYILINNETD